MNVGILVEKLLSSKEFLQTAEGRVALAEQLRAEQKGMSPRDTSYEMLQNRVFNHLYMAYERANRNAKTVKELVRENKVIKPSEVDAAIKKYAKSR